MNQTQRKFLLDSIETQFKKERSALRDEKPKQPSLNNYLTAAVLDGTFRLKSEESIRAAIRKRVVNLGQKETLVEFKSDKWNREDDKEQDDQITIPADIMFDMPVGYVEAHSAWEKAYEKWEKSLESLESAFEAMKIKVQLGSDKALSALVDQADALCSMSLTASSRLFIEPTSTTK